LLYRFRVWLDKILNHKKLFVLLWMSYIVAYIAVFIITITMSIYVGGCANHISDPINKLPPYPGFSNTSIVFNYISIIILLLPIAVLLITWIIGINGVPRSANFHTYVIISLLLVSLLLITSLILGISYIIEYNSFVRFPAAQA
jgi:hypothetical protein